MDQINVNSVQDILKKYKGLVVLGIFLFVGMFFVAIPLISYSNQEVSIRNQVIASQKSNEVIYDRVWKTIQQQAGVSEKYSIDFRNIYKDIMEARNPNGQGTLLKFITESNPNFDSSIFKSLMSSIEGNRRDFEFAQKMLIDKKREHDILLSSFPSGMYLGILGRKPIDIQLVTSERTEKAFKSGQDNNIDLFNK